VTDANLLLGRLRPEVFLGGQFQLDLARTRSIVANWLRAQKSNLSAEEFAAGVVRVVNATMEKAIRVVSVERGYDPRDFTLVAFGGAGGLHACELASALGIPRVIVPAYPGALSAFGILVSDVIKDYSRTILKVDSSLPGQETAQLTKPFADDIELQFRALREQAERDFASEGWSGKFEIVSTADVRYRGQGFELNIPWGRNLPSLFATEHKRRYGYVDESRAIEIVTLRLRARLKSKPSSRPAQRKKPNLPVQNAKIWLNGRPYTSKIYDRESLATNRWYPGPAIITEYSATAVVPSGMRFSLTVESNLVIEKSRKTKGAPNRSARL
jgi:N-methylhydantoinase A